MGELDWISGGNGQKESDWTNAELRLEDRLDSHWNQWIAAARIELDEDGNRTGFTRLDTDSIVKECRAFGTLPRCPP